MWKTIARFLKDKEDEPAAAPSAPEGFHLPLSATQLLSTTERRTMMVRIWENTSLPKETYQSLCLAPLHACAEAMQQFPMSSAGKFAYQGGMLDATLKTVLYALMKARSYMLPPGVPPEDQARDSAAWNTVVFYAALFSHLSALSALRVELESGEIWTPFDGVPELAYRFRFVPPGSEGADTCLGAMFAARVLPEGVFPWLKLHPPALDMLLLWVGGHRAQCGVINAIVSDAIAEIMGAAPAQPVIAATGMAAAPLVSAVTMPGVVSAPVASAPSIPPVAAVPVLASALAVPPQTVAEAAAPADSEVTHSVPETHVSEDEDNTDWEDVAAFLGYEEAASETPIKSAETPVTEHSPGTASQGEIFWSWLLASVENGSLAVNSPEAKIHLVAGSVFVQVPAIFHQFAAENDGVDDLDCLRQNVEAQPHIRRREGKLYRCRLYEGAGGGFSNLSGYFIDAGKVYGQNPVPSDNPLMVVPKRKQATFRAGEK